MVNQTTLLGLASLVGIVVPEPTTTLGGIGLLAVLVAISAFA